VLLLRPWLTLAGLCLLVSCCGWYAGWQWYRWRFARRAARYASPSLPPSPPRAVRRKGDVFVSTPTRPGGGGGGLGGMGGLASYLFGGLGGGLTTLQSSLRSLRGCRELWLKEIDDEAAAEIADALRPHYAARLEVLGLSSAISDEGGEMLCEALRRGGAPALTELHLSGNRLGDRTARALADAMRAGALPHLRDVRLNYNEIGDAGAQHLAGALLGGGAPRLEDLWLGGNLLSDRGAEQLARVLRAGGGPGGSGGGATAARNLSQLALYSNEIGDVGALALADALEERNRRTGAGGGGGGGGGGGSGGASGGGGWTDGEVRSCFTRFDANRSGKMDHRELREALRALGVATSGREATAILQRYDDDGNGLLDVDEFGNLVRQFSRGGGGGGGGGRGTRRELFDAAAAAWQSAVDDDGRTYWYNEETGESQWERPTAAASSSRAQGGGRGGGGGGGGGGGDGPLSRTMVLLAVNPIGEHSKQRLLAVDGIELDQATEQRHGSRRGSPASRARRGGPSPGRGATRCVDPYSLA